MRLFKIAVIFVSSFFFFLSSCHKAPIAQQPPENKPPVAVAGHDQAIYSPATSAVLDGSASTDIDGKIASYSWTQLYGPSAATIQNSTTSMPMVSCLQLGDYCFELTVTDNSGATATDLTRVEVMK